MTSQVNNISPSYCCKKGPRRSVLASQQFVPRVERGNLSRLIGSSRKALKFWVDGQINTRLSDSHQTPSGAIPMRFRMLPRDFESIRNTGRVLNDRVFD